MFHLILKCIFFSFVTTVVFLWWIQPHESLLFFQEIILPKVNNVCRRILKTFQHQPVIYDLKDSIHLSSSHTSQEGTDSYAPLHKKILNHEIKQAYKRDGVVAIRGLISPQLQAELDKASQVLISREKSRLNIKGNEYSSGKQFQTKKMSPIFELDENLTGFRHAALNSILPKVVAELLDLDTLDSTNSTNVRVLRDVFLAKDEGQYICGWHVDDWGFWPASASSDGVNVWIGMYMYAISSFIKSFVDLISHS